MQGNLQPRYHSTARSCEQTTCKIALLHISYWNEINICSVGVISIAVSSASHDVLVKQYETVISPFKNLCYYYCALSLSLYTPYVIICFSSAVLVFNV